MAVLVSTRRIPPAAPFAAGPIIFASWTRKAPTIGFGGGECSLRQRESGVFGFWATVREKSLERRGLDRCGSLWVRNGVLAACMLQWSRCLGRRWFAVDKVKPGMCDGGLYGLCKHVCFVQWAGLFFVKGRNRRCIYVILGNLTPGWLRRDTTVLSQPRMLLWAQEARRPGKDKHVE